MYQYRLELAKYRLREYETLLALRELENQVPNASNVSQTGSTVEFETAEKVDRDRLRRLAFYSDISFWNERSYEENSPTDQFLIEQYRHGPNEGRARRSRELRYLTHSFHEYKGRFYPQLAKSLINYAGLQVGDRLLDPFCGSGTTLVESALAGISAVGVDVNPIAVLLARAKVQCLSLTEKDHLQIDRLLLRVDNYEKKTDLEPDIKYRTILDFEYLERWFPRENLNQILRLLKEIDGLEDDSVRLFFRVILSSVLRTFSYQDPKQLRIHRRKDEPATNLFETFSHQARAKIEDIRTFQTLFEPTRKVKVRPVLGDIRTLRSVPGLRADSIDAVVTSPPYATALPYVDTDRLSLFVLGFTDRKTFRELERSLIGNREISTSIRLSLESELEKTLKKSKLPDSVTSLLRNILQLNLDADVGFRRKNTAALLYKYFSDMNLGLSNVNFVLKRDRLAFFVVGNNHTVAGGDHIDIPTDDFIGEIAEANGFRLIEKIDMSVQKSNSIHSKNAINTESILVLKKR